jgi:hypothetical protein
VLLAGVRITRFERAAALGRHLYTRYGKGVYPSSAYSWFRQLPAGVIGAFRIFANMLSAK